MDARTQPVLCCLSIEEEDDPSQFVMERLLESTDEDWKVITAAIAASRLSEALAGIQALNFSAAHFSPSLPIADLSTLLASTPETEFIGASSSAMFVDGSWRGWHSYGFAIMQLLQRRTTWDEVGLVVGADTIRSRSLLFASLPIHSKICICIDAPDIEQDWKALGETDSSTVIEFATDLGEYQQELESCKQFVFVGEEDDKAMEALVEFGKEVLFFPAKENGDNANAAFSALELNVTMAAYDFHRWTGVSADQDILQDAFEEYCSF